jgi:cell division protein FtsI (penicillin-binding protein 3)
VHDLGFGSTTAINFPGETAGLLVNSSDYYPSDNVALPIGQVDAVSPIQVLDAYNAIANGGVFVEPSLVRGYIYANGAKRSAPLNATHRVLSTKVDQQLIGMLKQVVLEGTGTNAIIPGYLVAGKTGTASIPVPGRAALLAGAYNASFVGFAPANAPVFSMLVLVQRPTTTIFGGSVAAPVFQAVMSYALHHYNIASSGVTQRPLSGSGASISSDVT